MKHLIFRGIEFLSSMDEDSFFTWLGKIECITEVLGDEEAINISIGQSVSDYDLREIIAIAYRYGADMTQLRVFLTDKNKGWFFENTESYWHKEVFY
ncbi:hypothetical protein M8R19_11955 [Pseudomonas sp. R3.Fl]|uniref:hypothetical protein n=1 Tax=Pseudomonas TaxID=286 RepID=UPI00201E58BC|nr:MULTISPECIES: hypothetical protein [Pseudomonas]MCL6689422.1 hypothetical protein [Pseudomonas sp. R3.Fl]MCP1642912.1 hypothetical protein [Pseudomonas citronellolis]MCP1665956.1 hypothetical protein [Pseudomonas citronellolis]MCP1696865.1 hypothetical protein [Pseudomonas citronellolis]MCP1703393.1 hypothetical protein [Pseudomonas citronellolis]